MLFTPHTLIGGAIGMEVDNLPTAFVIGVISHFVLDFIPHFDTTDGGKYTFRQNLLIAIDLIVGGSLLLYFWIQSGYNMNFFFGALGGIAPDLLDVVPFWKERFRKTKFGKFFHKIHDSIQIFSTGPVLGIATQIVLILIAVFMLK